MNSTIFPAKQRENNKIHWSALFSFCNFFKGEKNEINFEIQFPRLDTIIIFINSHKLSAHTGQQHFKQSRKRDGLVGPYLLYLNCYLLTDSGRRGITILFCVCTCWAHDSSKPSHADIPGSSSCDTKPTLIIPLATLPVFLNYLQDSPATINKYPINLYYVILSLPSKYILNLTIKPFLYTLS